MHVKFDILPHSANGPCVTIRAWPIIYSNSAQIANTKNTVTVTGQQTFFLQNISPVIKYMQLQYIYTISVVICDAGYINYMVHGCNCIILAGFCQGCHHTIHTCMHHTICSTCSHFSLEVGDHILTFISSDRSSLRVIVCY